MSFYSGILSKELINKIGEAVDLKMWDKRDKTKTYSYPGARDDEDEYADNYVNGVITKFKDLMLLTFLTESIPGLGRGSKSHYTLNLKTLRPTGTSTIKTELSAELKAKIIEQLSKIKFF
jgi:hypothetical protein